MDTAMTIWRTVVVALAIWRLSRLLFEHGGPNRTSSALCLRPENLFGNRILDGICWLSIWLSAQTALWVASGLAGLLLNWFVLATLSRLLTPAKVTDNGPLSQNPLQLRTAAPNKELLCLSVERRMQANHA